MEEKGFSEQPGKPDRKLGDLWLNWNGDLAAHEVQQPFTMWRFLLFTGLGSIALIAMIGFFYYLILPRLEQVETLPVIAGAAFLAACAAILAGYIAVLMAAVGPKIRLLSRLARLLAGLYRPLAFRLGKLVGISRDRMSASYISVQNRFVLASSRKVEPEKLLILLPRCLKKESMKTARAVAEEFGCKAGVAGGGSVARKLIAEHKPRAIVALACERDLYTGLLDVGSHFDVLALPNNRPDGPCRNTGFNVEDFRASIDFFVNGHSKD